MRPSSSFPVAVVLLVVVTACGGDRATTTPDMTASDTSRSITTTTTEVSTTTTIEAPTTATSPAEAATDDMLELGDRGPAVLEVQQRLTELGYWLGPIEGVFGEATRHAVVALQKVAGLERDGVVGPVTRRALDDGVVPEAQSRNGRVIEIDLATQVLLVVGDGRVEAVFDTSTGSVLGTTPPGTWKVEREIDGLRRSPLGLLYRPKYFHEGVAVHGYTSVPPYPASHGCVRVTYPAMDHIWSEDLMPIDTPVVVR